MNGVFFPTCSLDLMAVFSPLGSLSVRCLFFLLEPCAVFLDPSTETYQGLMKLVR